MDEGTGTNIFIGNINHVKMFVSKGDAGLAFLLEMNEQLRNISFADMEKIIKSGKMDFKDESTKTLIVEHLSGSGFFQEPVSTPEELPEPDVFDFTLDIPKKESFPQTDAAFYSAPPISQNSFPTELEFKELPMPAAEKGYSQSGAVKNKFNWSVVSLAITSFVFVAWILFVIVFGIFGGKNVPGVKSLYSASGGSTQETSSAPSGSSATTQPAP